MAVDTAAVIGPTGRVWPYFDDFDDNSSDDDDDDDDLQRWLRTTSIHHNSISSSDDESCSCDTDVTNKIANLNEENKISHQNESLRNAVLKKFKQLCRWNHAALRLPDDDYDHDGSLLVWNLLDKIPDIDVLMRNDGVTEHTKNNRFMIALKAWLNFVWDDVANVLWPLPTGPNQTMASHQIVRQQQAAQHAAQPAAQRAMARAVAAVAAVVEFVVGDSESDGGSGSTGSSSTRGPRSDRQRVAEKMREYILEVDSLLFSDGPQHCKLSSFNNHNILLKMDEYIRNRFMTREYRTLHERNQLRNQVRQQIQALALANALANQALANQTVADQAPGVVDDASEEEEYEV